MNMWYMDKLSFHIMRGDDLTLLLLTMEMLLSVQIGLVKGQISIKFN